MALWRLAAGFLGTRPRGDALALLRVRAAPPRKDPALQVSAHAGRSKRTGSPQGPGLYGARASQRKLVAAGTEHAIR